MKKKSLAKHAKEAVGLGIVGNVGISAVGQVGSGVPHTGGVTQAVSGGVRLANVGKMTEIGLSLMPKGKKGKSTGDKRIDKILYK